VIESTRNHQQRYKLKKGREREKKSSGSVIVSHLTRNGEPIRLVCALDDAADALDGAHELRELVRAEVGEAWDGARRAYEHVWKNKTLKKKCICFMVCFC
jgi:hypothetical protein